jgi:hypothetical protein
MNDSVAYEDWIKINEFVSDPDAHAYVLICQKLIDKGFLEVNIVGREMGFIKYEFTLKEDKQNG